MSKKEEISYTKHCTPSENDIESSSIHSSEITFNSNFIYPYAGYWEPNYPLETVDSIENIILNTREADDSDYAISNIPPPLNISSITLSYSSSSTGMTPLWDDDNLTAISSKGKEVWLAHYPAVNTSVLTNKQKTTFEEGESVLNIGYESGDMSSYSEEGELKNLSTKEPNAELKDTRNVTEMTGDKQLIATPESYNWSKLTREKIIVSLHKVSKCYEVIDQHPTYQNDNTFTKTKEHMSTLIQYLNGFLSYLSEEIEIQNQQNFNNAFLYTKGSGYHLGCAYNTRDRRSPK